MIKGAVLWGDTPSGVSPQFYSPLASDIAFGSDIRLWRVVFASQVLEANRIPLKPQGFNITTRRSRIISLRRSRNITHIAKRESFAKYLFALLSLFSANSSAPWLWSFFVAFFFDFVDFSEIV